MHRTQKGRVASELAYHHLGIEYIAEDGNADVSDSSAGGGQPAGGAEQMSIDTGKYTG